MAFASDERTVGRGYAGVHGDVHQAARTSSGVAPVFARRAQVQRELLVAAERGEDARS